MSAISRLRAFKKFMAELFSRPVREWIYSVSTATVPLLGYVGWKEDNITVFILGIINAMFVSTVARLNTNKSSVVTPDGTVRDTPSIPAATKAVVEASQDQPLTTVKTPVKKAVPRKRTP